MLRNVKRLFTKNNIVCQNKLISNPIIYNYNISRLYSNNEQRKHKNVLVELMNQIGSRKEVELYLKHFSSLDSKKFAIIKVGGGVINTNAESLSKSVAFLHGVGLTPIILHGAGPQLNARLKEKGIESKYINGLRVTTSDILKEAREIFLSVNLQLISELEKHGCLARPVVSGVFEAEIKDKSLGYVGEIENVNANAVYAALDADQLPILTCLGESSSGQILNINADIAASKLAMEIQPYKVIYISDNGGLRDPNGKLIRNIDLQEDYDILMKEKWFKHGNRLKLRQIKELLNKLPPTSSVAITSADNLPRELFTHKGQGTLIRNQGRVDSYDNLNEIDLSLLKNLIEDSFKGKLSDDYFESIQSNIHRVYIGEDYRACAIITKIDGIDTPYLSKFAVSTNHQSDGFGQRVWEQMQRDIPKLFWRSRVSNQINNWYFQQCHGALKTQDWSIFWYGINNENVQSLVDCAVSKKPDIQSHHFGNKISSTSASSLIDGNKKRRFSTKNVGLIGARGHTGSELIRLLAKHPKFTLSVASSRSVMGKKVEDIVKNLPNNCSFKELTFQNLSPADISKHQDVDLWILAMPNNYANSYVQSIESTTSKGNISMIDLSADFRFNNEWTYGLPERHDRKQLIMKSQKIANPGCYATGIQLGILPIYNQINGLIHAFGISGYSGAGTTPNRKNNIEVLKDNMIPYSLVEHVHEREVNRQFNSHDNIRFYPHVASWFRGITLTISMELSSPVNRSSIIQEYEKYYSNSKLVKIINDIPEVKDIAGKHEIVIGGFTTNDSNRLVINVVLDNLLKGAATQCLQNMNLMMGFDEYSGILKEE